MKYFIFLDNRDFEQGSLQDHLSYLRNYDGTPDFWDSKDDLLEALQTAKEYTETAGIKSVITDEFYEVQETYEPNQYKVLLRAIRKAAPASHKVNIEHYEAGGGFEIRISKSKDSRHGNLLIAGEGTKYISLIDCVTYKTVYHAEQEKFSTIVSNVLKTIDKELY